VETLLILSAILVAGWFVLLALVAWALRGLHCRVRAVGGRARLAARAYGVGPVSEVARLRRQMSRSLAGARHALAAARAVHAPVGDVPSLLARLELAASGVDAELRMLEAQPDRLRIAAQLPGPRSRAEAISSSAAHLVEGLLAAAGHDADELSLLQAACGVEADALRSAARRPVPAHDATPARQSYR
jgi:hypothetical protein